MKIQTPTQINRQNKKKPRPKTYFQLIQRVGLNGPYQRNMFLIFFFQWLVIGSILTNVDFLFINGDFQCLNSNLLTLNCQQIVCKLPQKQWKDFIIQEQTKSKSLATEFQQYYCQDQIYLDISYLAIYIGNIFGLMVFAYISDNFGRKSTILTCLFLAIIGSLLVCFSQSLMMASIGLFMSGFGSSSSTLNSLYFFSEVFTNKQRQKKIILLSAAFCLGSMLVTCMHYLIANWRIVMIISICLPLLVNIFLSFIYIQQTPIFLLKNNNKSMKRPLKALNRIGKINFKIRQIVQQEDIISVEQQQLLTLQSLTQLTNNITIYDLVKYDSLNFIFYSVAALYFILGFMQYVPDQPLSVLHQNTILGEGFNIYSESLIIGISQLVIYIPVFYYIEEIPRQKIGQVIFSIITLCSAFLIFVEIHKQDQGKTETFKQAVLIIIIFVWRSSIVIYQSILFAYINQLFPIAIIGHAFGLSFLFGIISNLIAPFILQFLQQNNVFNPMILFCILGVIGISLARFLSETKDKKMKVEIQEINQIKNQHKLKNESKFSFRKSSLVKSVGGLQKKISSPMIKSEKN